MAKKRQADKLQKIEEETNFEKQHDYYCEKRQRLLESQNRTIKSFTMNVESNLLTQKAAKNKELLPLQARVNKLNLEIEQMLEKRGIKPQVLNFESVSCDRSEKLKPDDSRIPQKRRSRSAMSSQVSRGGTITKPRVQSSMKKSSKDTYNTLTFR